MSSFALPALGLVALMVEVLPASDELNSLRHHRSKKPSAQQEKAQDPSSLQEDGEVVEASTAAPDDPTAAKRAEIQRQQQQQLLVIGKQQQHLREAMRKGLLSWTEVASWKLTFIEVQRLLLRIVQLKMPPAIAALLPLELQVEEFLRRFSAAVSPPLRDTQQLLSSPVRQTETQEQQLASQQFSLSGDESPAARSDATFSAATTADGEQAQRCFWHGFCGTFKGRQIYDRPIQIDESIASDVPESEDGAESESSNSSN